MDPNRPNRENENFRQNLERLMQKPSIAPKPNTQQNTQTVRENEELNNHHFPSVQPASPKKPRSLNNQIHLPSPPIVQSMSPVKVKPLKIQTSETFEEDEEESDTDSDTYSDTEKVNPWFCGLFMKKKPEQRIKVLNEYKLSSNLFIALFDYKRRSRTDMDFKKGDLFKQLKDQKNAPNDWINLLLLQGGEQGLVPKSFVAKYGSIEAQEWFFGKLSYIQAEELLMHKKNSVGTFLIRHSEKDPNSYTLSVKSIKFVEDRSERVVAVKHFRIKRSKDMGYFIKANTSFENLEELVEYYHNNSLASAGTIITLKMPCQKKVPVIDLTPEMSVNWEINRNELKLKEKIGSGQFGEVWYGKWKGTVEVAIKELKPNSMSKDEFLREAATMKTFRHENLVKLYCICNEGDKLYIVTEYMKNGSLLDYLRKNVNKFDLDTLHHFSAQIAAGMSYLEDTNLVHRDLAARNVLVGLYHVAKVADFGLAKQIKAGTIISDDKLKMCPIRWTAPEALLYGEYSTKSDVYSFGVVLMEIYTFGKRPWPKLSNAQILQAVERGQDRKMDKPVNFDENLYNVMLQCWDKRPSKRPTFEHLKELFDAFKMNSHQYDLN